MTAPAVGFAGLGRMGAAMARHGAALMRKDLRLAHGLADDLGLQLPAAEAAADVLDEALHDGLGEADKATVPDVLRPANARTAVTTSDNHTEEP